MSNEEKIIFKNKLKKFCHDLIQQRIDTAKELMHNAQQASNSEEKSSAGDKYETSRAMGHLEKDMHARQLTENLKELSSLHDINPDLIYAKAVAGAFVECEHASFFIAAGLGKQVVDDRTILFLSPQAPLAKMLLDKATGDSFVFNGTAIKLLKIF